MSSKSCVVLAAALLCSGLPAWGQELPDGPGKELAATNCNACHSLLSRVGAGYTPEGWHTVLRMMVNQGAPLQADQMAPLEAYLIKSFPEKPKPAGVIIPGPAEISFKAWQAPTPGSRPHDPLAASDGALWYTGQLANVLGRVDPKSGEIKEFPLKTPHSGPHGLQEDKEGNIWYTGNTGSLIGKLDPKTGKVTEYQTPESGDPHTLIFDGSGSCGSRCRTKPDRTPRPEDRRDQTADAADRQFAALRHGAEFQGRRVLCRIRHQQGRQRRSEDDGISEYLLPDAAPARGASRSPATTSSGTPIIPAAISVVSTRDRQGDGVAVSERAKVRAVWYLGHQRRHLVQRIRIETQHRRALRSQNPEIPELGDPGRRQHRAQHLGHARRQLRARQ
jgi:Streptogramin lyase